MTAWDNVLKLVREELKRLCSNGVSDPFFRGHTDASWNLSCGAGRIGLSEATEGRLYFNFISWGGHLIEPGSSSRDILYLMQHHNIPTRLLDCTESFGVALYFALSNPNSDGVVWILDPYELNKRSQNYEHVEYLNIGFPEGYHSYFIEDRSPKYHQFPASVVAISGGKASTRMRSQRGVFTLHRDIEEPLEKLFPNVVSKIVIPIDAFQEAQYFLGLAGINEFSLFPDLDGLSRYLRTMEL